ncbi:MAG: aspartate aminotransferase family protein [Deltaproteobacteria bacterium]|nr:aspartate aminotransferase family protein [Deltaproteobacteria bacterium]
MQQHEIIARYERHVSPAFVKLLGVLGYGRVFVRAQDRTIWDSQGRAYLDALAGFGSANLGHNPPALLDAIREHLEQQLPGMIHVGPSPSAANLAHAIASEIGGDLQVSLFALSGAEAVDSALKLARAATGRRGFLSVEGGYHGLDLGVLSIMGSERMRAPFEPLLPACERVAFGDVKTLERALATERFAAFVVEPVLGEGGAVIAPSGYLAQARALCTRHNTVMIVDEVQTGMGRTGVMFASASKNAAPDVLVLGKALGGGIVPVSVAVTTRALHERAYGSMDRFDLHGSTYAGYALGAAVAMATLACTKAPEILQNARARGRQLVEGLRARVGSHPMVRSVRGEGLLVALELGATERSLMGRLAGFAVDAVAEKILGQWLAVCLLEAGIIAQPASQRWNVLKLTPPLTITEPECAQIIEAIGSILDAYPDPVRVVRDAAARIGGQWQKGWSFR